MKTERKKKQMAKKKIKRLESKQRKVKSQPIQQSRKQSQAGNDRIFKGKFTDLELYLGRKRVGERERERERAREKSKSISDAAVC